MRYILMLAAFSALLLFTLSAYTDVVSDEDVRDEVVGLFGTLLTPSIFTPASSEDTGFLIYGRKLTDEGEVPDFDGDIEDEIDEMAIFASGRIGGLGLTLGFGEGSDFEFSKPFIAKRAPSASGGPSKSSCRTMSAKPPVRSTSTISS